MVTTAITTGIYALLALLFSNPAILMFANQILAMVKELMYVSHMCVLQLHYS